MTVRPATRPREGDVLSVTGTAPDDPSRTAAHPSARPPTREGNTQLAAGEPTPGAPARTALPAPGSPSAPPADDTYGYMYGCMYGNAMPRAVRPERSVAALEEGAIVPGKTP